MTHVKNAIYQQKYHERWKDDTEYRNKLKVKYNRYNEKRYLYKSIINEFYKIQLCFFN